MEKKLFTVVREDKSVNGREFTKVKVVVNMPILTKEVGTEIFGVEPTPGFRIIFQFNGKIKKIAWPVRFIDGNLVFSPLNDFRSKNPDEERPMLEFGGGDSFRNVFKDDPNYEAKVNLQDVQCFYDSTKFNFEVSTDKLFEI